MLKIDSICPSSESGEGIKGGVVLLKVCTTCFVLLELQFIVL